MTKSLYQGDINLHDLKFAELADNETKKLMLREGDLLFVRTNGNPDYVGRCASFDLEKSFLFASYLTRARLDKKRIHPIFASTLLCSPAGQRVLQPYIRTTASQSNIGIERLGQIPVIVPPLALQERFAAIARLHERLRGQQREALRQAEQLFDALLGQAFRGELGETAAGAVEALARAPVGQPARGELHQIRLGLDEDIATTVNG